MRPVEITMNDRHVYGSRSANQDKLVETHGCNPDLPQEGASAVAECTRIRGAGTSLGSGAAQARSCSIRKNAVFVHGSYFDRILRNF